MLSYRLLAKIADNRGAKLHHSSAPHSKFTDEGFILKALNISHYYKKTQALYNINIDVSHGETLFITGESGAGKSTLLKILSNQMTASSGELKWAKGHPPHIAWVSQNIELIENMDLLDNLWVAYQPKKHGELRQFESEVLELAKYFNIFDRLSLPMKNANGGLRQMVTMMRALISRPELLILDEPTKSLDEKNAIKAFELMNYYCQKQKTAVVWASHNRSLIKKFSGKMVHLERGKIVYSGQACFI